MNIFQNGMTWEHNKNNNNYTNSRNITWRVMKSPSFH